MNIQRLKISGLASVASVVCLVVTYFHYVYWVDIVAGYSSYLVSMLIVPAIVSMIVGNLFSRLLNMSRVSKVVVTLTPPITTSLLYLLVHLLLQYAEH